MKHYSMDYNKSISLKHLYLDNQAYVGIQFKADKVLEALINTLIGVQWSDKFSMFYIENTKKNIDLIFNKFRGVAWVNTNYFYTNKPIHEGNEVLDVNWFRKRTVSPNYKVCPEVYLEKLELKRYANNTVKTYVALFEAFINYYKDNEVKELDENDVRNYLKHLIQKKVSDSYINQAINSIKFYYEVVKGMPNRFYSIERPQKKFKLPTVLSVEEISALLKTPKNIKHQCIIQLLYSAGLRRGELINLTIKDIDSNRMLIKVIDGKGGKDRYTLLSEALLKNLRIYYKQFKPKEYLFEGQNGGKYGAETIGKIIKRAAYNAKIIKNISAHTLRHSFATHLLENGVDLRYIQSLLGHSSSKTTEIYTHVAINKVKGIKSPLDSISL